MSNEDKTPFGSQLFEGATTRADLFWMKQATALRERLADKGADFIKMAACMEK